MKKAVQTLFLLAITVVQLKVSGQDPLKIDMIYVEGGTLMMGCTPEQKGCDETSKPAHQVTLDGFYIGKYEVTQAQWEAVMGYNPSPSKPPGFRGANKPVNKINWDDTQKFISKLNQMTGLKYRLPTDAEWEYAARGGNQSKGYRYSGGDKLDEVAWYGKNSKDTVHDVGTKKANELGIHDMSGNVAECVNDWYIDYTDKPQTNPKGPKTGKDHIFRGGDYANYKLEYSTIVNRIRFPLPDRFKLIGFRLALDK